MFPGQRAPGSVSFNYEKQEPRLFHVVHSDGIALELDANGNINRHTGSSENRVAQKIGQVPRIVRDRLWNLFVFEQDGRVFDCHMAAGFVDGQELSPSITIPVGQPMTLEAAVQKFGTPFGMQLRQKNNEYVIHSAVILSSSGGEPIAENTMAYHKRGQGAGEILPVTLVLQRYKFDPQEHECAFYAFSDASIGES